ncbi:MAG: PAS domain-containing protein, partial [Bacteroidetes bacterium]|nr:PAS domain-containing protein [Fibrella sp.]
MADIDLLKAALDHSDAIIIMSSSLRSDDGKIDDFRILLANDKAATLTGMSVKELSGQKIRNVLPASLTSDLWQQAAEVVETGMPFAGESEFMLDSGEIYWFSTAVHRHGDGAYFSFQDITAGKHREQEVQKTINELRRSNQNLEQFAYIASHDLQEPLRKLIGFGDILQSQYDSALGNEGAKLVQRMQSATQRMNVLIKDLLSFSKVTSAREPLRRIDLQQVVNQVINDLEPIIREKNVVLDVTSLPYLEGDAGQLGQLFQNLLSNALKFTRPGDIPLVRVDCEVIMGSAIQPMPGTTVLATDLNRSFFAITVSDNGIGF